MKSLLMLRIYHCMVCEGIKTGHSCIPIHYTLLRCLWEGQKSHIRQLVSLFRVQRNIPT